MITYFGQHNTATVYANDVESTAIEQIYQLCDQEYLKNASIRFMPDVHAGHGCTIGTTIMTDKLDAIDPNLIGVDIGCGVSVYKLKDKNISLRKLDDVIHKHVPSGKEIFTTSNYAGCLIAFSHASIDLERSFHSMGTLGGGNHFIEIDKDDEDNLYLLIHSGSRHVGVEIAKYYQDIAAREFKDKRKEAADAIIKSCKAAGQEKLIATALTTLKATAASQMAALSKNNLNNYLHDVQLAQEWAEMNRAAIAAAILNHMHIKADLICQTIHNYIDFTDNYVCIRKGAVSAKEGEKLIIPLNMRDGALLCTGLGNPDWNYSAPHGAGRRMSRHSAFDELSLDEYKREMSHIYSSCVTSSTLDESPMAYKDAAAIAEQITDTVKVDKILKPIYNFKAI